MQHLKPGFVDTFCHTACDSLECHTNPYSTRLTRLTIVRVQHSRHQHPFNSWPFIASNSCLHCLCSSATQSLCFSLPSILLLDISIWFLATQRKNIAACSRSSQQSVWFLIIQSRKPCKTTNTDWFECYTFACIL